MFNEKLKKLSWKFRKKLKQLPFCCNFQEIIDKGDDYEEVPDSKLVVTRTAYKDNSSFYLVQNPLLAWCIELSRYR